MAIEGTLTQGLVEQSVFSQESPARIHVLQPQLAEAAHGLAQAWADLGVVERSDDHGQVVSMSTSAPFSTVSVGSE